MQELGGRVASVWAALRPSTKNMVERALQASMTMPHSSRAAALYDARSEWELSRLLAALDDRPSEAGARALNAEQTRELGRVAETCAYVLQGEARSAEVFGQLLLRALRARDYARVDALADTLTSRLAPSEICELARHEHAALRALAVEALAQAPTGALFELLDDPVYGDTARAALETQADDYDVEEARWIVNALARAEMSEDDL